MPKTETTILAEKRNFGTKAAIDANISQMADGEMVYLTDEGITPPIPTSTDVNKILKTNQNGLYTLGTISKNDVGLNNVDNTSDMDKPVSTAQGQAIAAKTQIARVVWTV